MRCQKCDHPLWGARDRACPECGQPFHPGDHEFAAASVHFCCPHCQQPYLGTDARGHPDPGSFDCSCCGNTITLDDMVVCLPPRVSEAQTKRGEMPWMERRSRGTAPAFLKTLWLAHFSPARLAEGLPSNAPVGHALAFGVLMLLVTLTFGGVLPASIYWFWDWYIVGGWWSDPTALVLIIALHLFALAGFVPVWAMVTQAILRATGSVSHSVDRTMTALGYSTAANLLCAIPCLGLFVGCTWWMCSAVAMVRVGQGVSTIRAAVAVLLLPLCTALFAALISVVFGAWWFSFTGTAPMWDVDGTYEAELINSAVISYAATHDGTPPPHAASLLLLADISTIDFVAADSDTYESEIPVGSARLEDLEFASVAQVNAAIADALKIAAPDSVVHRLGDFVFTYHGMNVTTAPDDLWLVIMIEDPDALDPGMNTRLDPIVVGSVDGAVVEFPRSELTERVSAQNVLRAAAGLAPLPDLRTVRHDQVSDAAPATTAPQDPASDPE